MTPTPPPSASSAATPAPPPGPAAAVQSSAGVGPILGAGRGRRQASWKVWSFLRGLLVVLAAGALSVGVFYGVRAVRIYGQKQVERRIWREITSGRIDLRIDFATHPNFMHRDLLNSVLSEAQRFAQQTTLQTDYSGALTNQPGTRLPVLNYYRLCNPLDDSVLGELSERFTAQPSVRQNAWIKRIIGVRRIGGPTGSDTPVVSGGGSWAGTSRLTILITAEFRQPVAFVVQGNSYYLMDAERVLLPGVYSAQDRKAVPQMLVLRNVNGSLPEQPGQVWNPPGDNGGGAGVGIQMAQLLAGKPFASQISSINLENLSGQVSPWIKLDTIFPLPTDPTRMTEIYWGRTPGQELYYEVTAAAKIKALSGLCARFGRVDAGREYVDVRLDQVRLPLSAPPAAGPPK